MLKDDEVEAILMAVGDACRHRKRSIDDLRPAHARKLLRTAENVLSNWCLHGVPSKDWNAVKACKKLVHDYNLFQSDEATLAGHSNTDEVHPRVIFNDNSYIIMHLLLLYYILG